MTISPADPQHKTVMQQNTDKLFAHNAQ